METVRKWVREKEEEEEEEKKRSRKEKFSIGECNTKQAAGETG